MDTKSGYSIKPTHIKSVSVQNNLPDHLKFVTLSYLCIQEHCSPNLFTLGD